MRTLAVTVVLALRAPGGANRKAVLTRLTDDSATLEVGGRAVTLPLAEVERAWDGTFIALWRPPASVTEPIGPGARGKAVVWLRQRLGELGRNPPPRGSPLYDDELPRRGVALPPAQQPPPH